MICIAPPGHAGHVGTVIQAYLYRSETRCAGALAKRIRIRLCKGAYKEPAEIAFQDKADVDANYLKLMKILLKSGVYHGIATHDEAIIKETRLRSARKNPSRLSSSRCSTASAATCRNS